MYRELSKKEIIEFTNKYFKEWSIDIRKVSVISYDNIDEYLINGHFILYELNN